MRAQEVVPVGQEPRTSYVSPEPGRRRRRIFGPAFAALLTLAGVLFFVVLPPGSSYAQSAPIQLTPPFVNSEGFAYVQRGIQFPSTARAVLLEDGHPIGPAHTPWNDIAHTGFGGYTFDQPGEQLYFSTSDNTDPNTNGRSYTVVYPVAVPFAVYLTLLLLLTLPLTYLYNTVLAWRLRGRGAIAALVPVSLFTVVVLAIVQVAFWAAVEDRVSRNLDVERVYRVLFEGRADDFAGEQIYYEPHQYLPYVLNPDRIVNGQRQFNAIFRIRRSEPIRTRSEVTWRALALGGSTTYGEPLADEADTWVAQLERLIRTEYGPSFDVINGGVGGYTLYENVIHYMTLLTHLDPDVVILFEGINDVHPRIFGEIAYDYSNYRTPWRNNEAFPPVDYRLAWLTPYRYIYLRHAIEPTALEGIGALVNKPYPDPSLWQEALQRNTVDNYRTMLENLVLLLRAQGRQVVIIPQYYLPRYDTDWIFKIGVDENNLVNHEIADKYNLPFVDSVIAPGTFEPGDTVDSTHFNADGSTKMANLMFAFMKQHGLLRTTDSS